MKLFFLKDQSLYKIFKTLEKIPDNKLIHIYIDPEHAFFDNEWWWKQIQEILTRKHLNAFFITKTDKAKRFFSKLGLNVIHQEKHQIIKVFNLIYLFFFNIKRYHLQVYTKKNYIFYVVFWFEVLFALLVLYLLYTFILPSASVNLMPTNQIENIIYNFRYYPASDTQYPDSSRFISIPFYSGFIDYRYEMSIGSSQIKHIQNPSKWTIKLINKTPREMSFLPNTTFTTNDGRIFTSMWWFKITGAVDNNYWEAIVQLKAAEQDANGDLMWIRGNIVKWTKVYIKNLKTSYYLQDIYWTAIQDFSWWVLFSNGIISQKDIDILSWKLMKYIYQQKKNIVWQNFNLANSMILSFDDLIKTDIKEIAIQNKPWERSAMLKWYIVVRLNFYYVKQEDIIWSMEKYINQRPTDKLRLITIDKNTLNFFNNLKQENGVFVIPTKISIIQSYDFHKDINWIIDSLKTRIVWLEKNKAKEEIFNFSEISSVIIKIRPPRYTTMPKLKSRIKFYANWKSI